MKKMWACLAAVSVLVVGFYWYTVPLEILETLGANAANTHYNLLVEGFRAGQLSVKKDVPVGFAGLANPYDPSINSVYQAPPYGLLDLSYYKGKLYLYWGITPALILFWPFVALTGEYLFHCEATALFCTIGFLASVGLLTALWRRSFSGVSLGVVVVCSVALGLATGVPVMLSRSDIYEVAISCGYMLTMLSLVAIWCALSEPERGWRWLALASLAYGLAIGARPSLLFGAVILLVPVAQAWHRRRRIWTLVLAAMGPIVLIGLGLMFYNVKRFDDPFEFGVRYQLAGKEQLTQQLFSLRYLWFNSRAYFVETAHWSAHFPWVHASVTSPLPAGYGQVSSAPFGVLTNIPLVWLALAAPLAWRNRQETDLILRWFVMAVSLLFGICALTVGFFWSVASRYEVEFLPELLLLAAVGILGLERALVGRPFWRRAARCGWGALLVFSVAFNLLVSVDNYAEWHFELGNELFGLGRFHEAVEQEERALKIKPGYAEAYNVLGNAWLQKGDLAAAARQFDLAVHAKKNYFEAHNNLAIALYKEGEKQMAIEHWEEALRLQPSYAEAHFNLGLALEQMGNTQGAISHYERALAIDPAHTKAKSRLLRLQAQQ